MTSFAPARRSSSEPLSVAIASLLRDGDLARRYLTRSEAEQAIALGARNAGWTCHEFGRALLDPKNKGGRKAQELERRDEETAWKYIEGCWSKACSLYDASPRSAVGAARRQEEEIDAIEAAASAAVWKGKAGTSALDTLLAHVAMARLSGGPLHRASVRQAAQRANLSPPTAIRAQHRLRDDGWLLLVETGIGAVSSKWLLTVPSSDAQLYHSSHKGGVVKNGKGALLSEDVFSWGGIGKTGRRLYAALQANPNGLTVTALMAVVRGPVRSTITRLLRKLESEGLARQTDDGPWAAVAGDFAAVADNFGVSGRGARRAKEFAEERARYLRSGAGLAAIRKRARGARS